jgi:uncharacterized membrane protein
MNSDLPYLFFIAAAFVASHLIFASEPTRGILARGLGEGIFRAMYSVLAAILLGWMILAWHDAPVVELWPKATGTRHLTWTVMLLASILFVGGYSQRNPTAIGLDRIPGGADPAPGILKITRHPILWAWGLWATVHLLANGDVRSVIFFGSFAVLAFAGTVLLDRKKRLQMGEEKWRALADATSNIPFVALVQRRNRLGFSWDGVARLLGGVALYVVLMVAHQPVIGVRPW